MAGFRPLIRGFFFYAISSLISAVVAVVSVPSFGDSFFICMKVTDSDGISAFPSPHSGILFLWIKLPDHKQ